MILMLEAMRYLCSEDGMGRLCRVHVQVEQVRSVNGEMVCGGAEGIQVAAILLEIPMVPVICLLCLPRAVGFGVRSVRLACHCDNNVVPLKYHMVCL